MPFKTLYFSRAFNHIITEVRDRMKHSEKDVKTQYLAAQKWINKKKERVKWKMKVGCLSPGEKRRGAV